MLDDFNELDSASFLEDLEVEFDNEKEAVSHGNQIGGNNNGPERLVLGMTAIQRFIISALMFSMVCVLGFFFLLVANKVVFPF